MLSDLRKLRALRAVGSLRSFSAAAEALEYTQSAISQQIAALEAEVGITLVERTRPPGLTEAGRLLIAESAPLFEHLASVEARLDGLRGLRAGSLRMASFGSAFSTLLVSAVARFRSEHPEVELELSEMIDSIPKLRAGELDLALVFDWSNAPAAPDPALDRQFLFDDDLRVVLPAEHPLTRRRTVPLKALAAERWITPSPHGSAAVYWNMLEELAGRAGFIPTVAHELDSLVATQAFIAAGQGIALMNDLTIPRSHPGLAVRSIEPRVVRRVWTAQMRDRNWPPAKAMIQLLRRSAAEWSAESSYDDP
jgi:DNA-binding transcriptional LysR family regulator